VRSARHRLRGWTATFLQSRRRLRRCPVAVLSAGVLTWTWPWADPAAWNLFQSHDGGGTFLLEAAGWPGHLRQYVPAEGTLPTYVVGVNANGNPVTEPSPVATAPAAPLITGALTEWDASVPGWADVTLTLTFNHGSFPVATLEILCILDGGEEWLAGTVASSAAAFTHGSVTQGESSLVYRARYRHGGVYGPFSPSFPWNVTV
jgi:hypothetical protein